MAIKSPIEPVYYYECSNGGFRLVYFIPPDELERLVEQDRISLEVLKDYPDGVDLTCREADFEEFHQLYRYRPQFKPDVLRRAFFAIFSTTHDWESFRGSGFIPAADIERLEEPIDATLRQEKMMPEDIEPLPEQPNLKHRRQWMDRRAVQQSHINTYLRQLEVDGIDPRKTLRQQTFSSVKMQDGKRADEVFSELHQKRKR